MKCKRWKKKCNVKDGKKCNVKDGKKCKIKK